MILGIVGPEASAWTVAGEEAARKVIRDYLATGKYAGVTSGACHKGGVDIWARQEAERANLPMKEFPPKNHGWYWYKQRNQMIARLATEVICIVPRLHPDGSKAHCKHCHAAHRSNGGCWTVSYAKKIGKPTSVIVVDI